MSTYRAPLQEMSFVLNELAGLAQVASLPGFEEATADTVSAILEEAAENPRIARNAPYTTPVRRLDEVAAAKHPVIRQALR